ncbi:MAG: hypothetical protein F2657_01050 [Actinobacteria bacterium]|uniref:Unannotated protein n=1 Tax=freshwater metagenome TaxID=449393 RepID=A0A6J6G1I4_9ZZZZ|nr:hypothetical protein [Actinomycetota bacterium]MSY04422.1 hypothetical protein [Actinomycetota bacterium]MSY66896.1 hypothetical protein [Actinomycetota bacterium]MSZ59308.1 hypothetical protein [Actinomycetota bacterium]MTA00638.1 hypothetical protein [Actinomycetota bacterium]
MIKLQEIRINRVQAIAIAAIFIVLLSQLLSAKPEIRKYSENISPTICPSEPSGVNSVVYLAAKKRGVATIKKGERKFKTLKTTSISIGSYAKEVEGLGASPLVVNVKPQSWIALTQCTPAISEKWVLGGMSTISSIGYFQFVNPNRSKAVIDLEIWSEDGKESNQSLVISAQSTRIVQLNSLITNKKFLAFHLIARAGRFSAVLFDERKKGLAKLGGDFVTPTAAPNKKVFVTSVIGKSKTQKVNSQFLRLLVPGEADAVVKLTYLAKSGIYSPVGLAELRVPAGKVVQLPFSSLPSGRFFALQIDATEPIIASVFSSVKGSLSDFAWSSGSEAINAQNIEAITVPAIGMNLNVYTEDSSVVVETTSNRKKVSRKNLAGIDTWKIPANVISIRIIPGAKPVYASFSVLDSRGVSVMAIRPVTAIERSALPISDSEVLTPRK